MTSPAKKKKEKKQRKVTIDGRGIRGAMPNIPVKRINVDLPIAQIAKMEVSMQKASIRSVTDFVRKAIAVLTFLLKHKNEDGTVVVIDDQGEEYTLFIG